MLKLKQTAVITLLLLLTGLSTSFCQNSKDTLTAVEAWGQLGVQGTNLVDSAGNPVQLQGMSLYWSNLWGSSDYYTHGAVEEINKFWCANVIRAAMGTSDTITGEPVRNGYLDDSSRAMNQVTNVVDAAIDEGIYVIIDWHGHGAHNNEAEAVEFFRHMAKKYGDTPNVIYEPYNEPTTASWANEVKPYLKTIIDTIRNYDPDNIIICGTPQNSSDIGAVRFDSIRNRNNIMYAYHYYAAAHRDSRRDDVRSALRSGLPVFVSEYGTVNYTGNGSIAETSAKNWWKLLNNNNISHLNWSLSDQYESSAALQPGAPTDGGWADSLLTESGIFVKKHLRNNCPDYRPEVTSIDKNNVSAQEITIYPNPASHTVHLKGPERKASRKWGLYNNLGKKVRKGSRGTIDVSGLSPGIYILRTGGETHKLFVR